MTGDMHSTIVPKSDQLNADDLIGREMTIKITGVDIRGGQEQPVSIHFEGDNGKPYKACKSMCRVMVTAWGADSKKYVGRSMTLYRDAEVKWGGMAVGGIRISHMSHLDKSVTMALTMTRANKKPYTVKPLQSTNGAPSQSSPAVASPPAERAESPPSTEAEGTLGSVNQVGSTPTPASTQRDYRKEIVAADMTSELSNRFQARLKAKVWGASTLEQLSDTSAKTAFEWISAEMDK